MAAGGAIRPIVGLDRGDVPALSLELNNECPLSCPDCFLDRNKAIDADALGDEVWVEVMRTAGQAGDRLKSVCVHGQEVGLVPNRLEATLLAFRAEQAAGRLLNAEFSFITSGVAGQHLADTLRRSCAIPDRIALSLDGPDAATNAVLRGAPSAFAAALRGGQALAKLVGVQRFTVALTLGPDNQHGVERMVDLLTSYGWRNLLVSPLVRRSHTGMFGAAISPTMFLGALRRLGARLNAKSRIHVQGLTLDDPEWSAAAAPGLDFGETSWLAGGPESGLSIRRSSSLSLVIRVRFDGGLMSGTEIMTPALIPSRFVSAGNMVALEKAIRFATAEERSLAA